MAKKPMEATGQIDISVDKGGLRAVAAFRPGEGEAWDGDRVLREMRAKGIVEGFKPEEVRRTFERAVEEGIVAPFAIAHGMGPTEPTPEQPRWSEIAIPGDLQDQARKVLEDAKSPEITIRKTERVKKEKLVTRKSKVPFLPDKQEKVTFTEERVSTERVYVDPTIERTGYATAGQKICFVEGHDPGEAGRTVTGDLIPPRLLPDPLLYAGPGAERKRDEIFAAYDGFVRIGANWVDVVPFETHDWELSLSNDQATCYLSFDPGHAHAKAPTPAQIREAAEELGFPVERLLDDEHVNALITSAVAERRPLEREPLTSSTDGEFQITVTDDKLSATLDVHKATGHGKPLDLKALGSAIKQSRLVGLDLERIKTDISAFIRSTDTRLTVYLLAEGRPPEPPPERSAEFSVRFLPPDRTAELVTTLASTPPDLDTVPSIIEFPIGSIEDTGVVELEQLILTIAPEVSGKPGVDVFGQPIAGAPAPEPAIKLYENLERKGNIVIAARSGMLHKAWLDGTIVLRVVPHTDGRVSVRLFESKMAATISMVPATGTGKPLAWEQVQAAVAEQRITSGAPEELLLAAFARVEAGQEIRDLIFARGKHPAERAAGEVEMLLELASGADVTIRADGRADFRNQDRITTVRAGTKIARIRPPEEDAEDGWDVCGTKIAAERGSRIQVDTGVNVTVEEDESGAKTLIAAIDGELTVQDGRFEIRAGHSVDGDVDLHSGNIKFPGTVTVKGSVRAGFYVMASGSIQVGELVEAALLSADGDIVINQGVKGGGKAVLRTKGAVGLTFAEQTTILAVGNVQARNSLVHCDVKTNGKVRMIGDKCKIIGGRIRAREGLETHELGSERGVKTRVEFGQNYLIADRIEKEEREMEQIKREITRIDQGMTEAERAGQRRALDALHAKKVQFLKQLEQRGLRVFTLRERFEEHHESELLIKSNLWPGVLIETHGRTLEVTAPAKNVVISFNPQTGQIEQRSAAKSTDRES